jgi:hypothetical protein
MRGRIHRALFIGALLALAAREARANDGAAGLGTGELVFKHLDGMRMQSEDLFISENQIRVHYWFRNTTDHDIETVVAFPLPPIPAKNGPACEQAAELTEAYDPCSDNPLGFTLTIDGQKASFYTERKPVRADRLVRDFSGGDGLPLGPASRMSNAFSSWHVQGRYGFIAACSAGSVRSSSG